MDAGLAKFIREAREKYPLIVIPKSKNYFSPAEFRGDMRENIEMAGIMWGYYGYLEKHVILPEEGRIFERGIVFFDLVNTLDIFRRWIKLHSLKYSARFPEIGEQEKMIDEAIHFMEASRAS